MQTVKVSPKFQVVIPARIRSEMGLKPGEKMAVIQKDSVIHMIPVGPIKKSRGLAKGVKTKGLREKHDRIG